MKRIAIIGAGIGGLTAGNLLAKKGHKVTVFEKHNTPGGYTAGFWRKGFYFESGTLSFESSADVFRIMKEVGVIDRVKFVRQVTTVKAGAVDAVCETFEDMKKAFYNAYPQEAVKLGRYFGDIDGMLGLMTAVMAPRAWFHYALYPLNVARFLSLYLKYKNVTITDFTARYFDPSTEFYAFFKSMGYPDMSAAIVPAAYMSFFDDYWTVYDGMQSWADALADNLAKNGGEIQLSARVDKILTRDGQAVGVVSNGKEYPADFVVSACDYKKTFLEMLDNPAGLPEKFRGKISAAAVSEGIFTVYLGLDITNERLKEHLGSPHVHFHDEKAGADIRNSRDADYLRKTSILLYSPSVMNQALAPGGKSSLMLQTAVPFRWLNNWGAGDQEKYAALKRLAKEALIDKASKVIPDLRRHIEFADSATPLTYERFTGNTDGATSAWSWNPKNKFYGNFMSVNIDTPVRNLLIGSCWSCQIGGIPSALNAAIKCAKKIG